MAVRPPQPPPCPSNRSPAVYVGNIPYQASEQEVRDLCQDIGPVASFKMILDRDTGKPKGYAFCEFRDHETALSACRNLNAATLRGRPLRVNLSSRAKPAGVGAAPLPSNVGIGGPGYLLPSSSLSFCCVNSCVDVNGCGDTQIQEERGQVNGKLGQLIGFLVGNYSQESLCRLLVDMLGMAEAAKEAVLALCPHLLNALFQAVPLATPEAFFSPPQLQEPTTFPFTTTSAAGGGGQKRPHQEEEEEECQSSPEMLTESRPAKRLKLQIDNQEQPLFQPSTPPHTQEPMRCGGHKRPAEQLPSHQGGGGDPTSPTTAIAFSTDHSPPPTKRARLQVDEQEQPPLQLTSKLLDYLTESVKNCSTREC